jgi:1-acyl-sn-glycerol-3-phosphate acyltransferase
MRHRLITSLRWLGAGDGQEAPMLPPRLVRRLVAAPLVVAIAAALAVLAPPVAILTVAFNLIRRRKGRMRLLRLVCFGLVWFLGETAALAVFGCLWIVSGFGGRLDTEPYQSRHYGILRRFLGLMYRTAERTCGLKVDVTGPPEEPEETEADPKTRPLIVLSRHAGPGDSLLLVHHLLSACGRRPRVVMKAALQLDPSLDIAANRLPNAFVQHRNAGTRHHIGQIKRLAAGLDPAGALVIFPEGGNWTPQRWRRSVARLRRQGLHDLAERAVAMPHVLAPRGGGALAAVAACPAADVVFVAHTGLDKLVSVRDVWQSLSADMEVRAQWWRVPAAQVPRDAGRDAQVSWLYDWWQRVDAWIGAQHADPAAMVKGSAKAP